MIIQIHKVSAVKWFTPLGWIIKKSQGTKWSHYGLAWSNNGRDMMVSDAKMSGIRRLPMADWLEDYESIDVTCIKLPISADQWEIWVESKIGTDYSFMQLIGIGLISLRLIKTNPFGNNKKCLVCHEYILIALARFLKLDIGDSDDYDFAKADKVIDSINRIEGDDKCDIGHT